MKVNLQQSYFWNRRTYGPGEVEIPDDLAIALGIAEGTALGIALEPDEPTLIEPPDKSATAADFKGDDEPTQPLDTPPTTA
ncbi:MAG: hypothetical protein SFY66_19775 [Oculatellaceae cyanobacterium bins.114]|nr:hypothetical protein [Oculatellaceae cyanobacterium bins.114]